MFSLLPFGIINISYKSELSYSKEWANSQLRFGIKLLKGQVCSQSLERAIADAVSLRWSLANAGFWWQAKRLDNWINRARQKGDFLEGKQGSKFTGRSPDLVQSTGEVSP
jgi:hypothetical protein